ncbi:MAG: hypothetical protein TREMPRED_003940 [Tremellales sp. Tagirdzhanova-0007]|nr:MAG: hypothetical protein TREMPRED_003940 [Tremellales sp. Tagirdzhanova-0007]
MAAPKETSSAEFSPSDPSDSRNNLLALFPRAPEPKTELGRYRILSPTAGVRVSPICLGSMSVGDQWTSFMGGKAMDQAQSEEYLDEFYGAGGNFIDTANNYHDEQSEHIIGEWMEKRGLRDSIVLATKYTTYTLNRKDQVFKGIGVNYCGNHKKSLRVSLENSLRKLRTDYVDILYVHWWDHSTSIEELMQSLNALVQSGKVLYLGISDTPVSQANDQGQWSIGLRDMEREIIPMCRHNRMAIAPYGVLGQGRFKTPEEMKSRSQIRGNDPASEDELKLCAVLQEVANELGGKYSLSNVAMAWTRQMMTDYGTYLTRLKALKIKFTEEQMKKLSEASPFSHGFPTAGFGMDPRALEGGSPNTPLMNAVM